jgi:carbonic anhydrase
MSNNTKNTTNSPINISPKSITGKCDLKCAYNFDYPTTNLVASNEGVILSLKCDNQTSTPVTFNNNKYNVEVMYIFAPSLHLFNGNKTPAELIIFHNPQSGGPKLSVCIPIVQSGNSSDASNLVSEIIELVSSGAPSVGETTTLNISNFTLNNIVPKKPFYNFNSRILGNCIVYGIMFAIPLSQTTLTTLTSIIQPYNLSDIGDGNLFFNSNGPNQSSTGDDGIYISCSPTGNSVETTDTTSNTNTNSSSSGYSFNYKKYEYVLWIILLAVGIIGIVALLNFCISKYTSTKRPVGLTNSKLNPDSGDSFLSSIKKKFA